MISLLNHLEQLSGSKSTVDFGRFIRKSAAVAAKEFAQQTGFSLVPTSMGDRCESIGHFRDKRSESEKLSQKTQESFTRKIVRSTESSETAIFVSRKIF